MEFVVNNAMKQDAGASAFDEVEVKQANIKVIGAGGAGGRAARSGISSRDAVPVPYRRPAGAGLVP